MPPTANIHDCGGLITAQKCDTPAKQKNIDLSGLIKIKQKKNEKL